MTLELEEPAVQPEVLPPAFVVELEPRSAAFFRNLCDLFWTPRQPSLRLLSYPGVPWPDVFVSRRMPWGGFAGSFAAHCAAVILLVSAVKILPQRAPVGDHPEIAKNEVIYYSPAEYLEQLDTGNAPAAQEPQKGDPEFAPQPIISVPPEPDNHVQTIVTPPNVKLDRDVPLPNIVEWSPTLQSVPLAATARDTTGRKPVSLDSPEVVAPTPEVSRSFERRTQSLSAAAVAPAPEVTLAAGRQVQQSPVAAAVAPAPQVKAEAIRRIGDMNIGRSEAVAPAPQLPVAERTAAARVGPLSSGSAIAPPPAMPPAGGSGAAGGRLIALNVRPIAPAAAPAIPEGNRRGSFAATPEGNPGARGTPDIKPQPNAETANGSSGAATGSKTSDAPPGLHVGAAPKPPANAAGSGNAPATSNNGQLMASITPSRVTNVPPRTTSQLDAPTPLERQVFGDRKFYRLNINMPNLNSSGGSWVVRFAPLKEDQDPGEVSSPVATQTADPGYPIELMRQNVKGTVTLYALIQSDGSVSDVKVLQSVDDRLDRYAAAALARWKFRPATRNGNPVALEAVVVIPFRPSRNPF
jgi:TonB family protein